jgi:predicted phosphodiesterase
MILSMSQGFSRFAAVADIHGNLPALETVIEDLARRGIDMVVNLGDHVSGPLWPRETARALMQLAWTHIAGNCDRQVAQIAPSQLGPSDRFAAERLEAGEMAWLRVLPPTATPISGVFLCHGTPDDDTKYLMEVVEPSRVRLARPGELRDRLGSIDATTLVLCGHSHVPRVVRVGDMLVVNPGSVGLPAYEHDDPYPHEMETGAPDARYAILERRGGEWSAELVAVPYSYHDAVRQAERRGREDWAVALRTGFAR